jgi:hypothetical protein
VSPAQRLMAPEQQASRVQRLMAPEQQTSPVQWLTAPEQQASPVQWLTAPEQLSARRWRRELGPALLCSAELPPGQEQQQACRRPTW